MPIELLNPEAYTVAPTEGFVPDRLGVRQVSISADRDTGAYAVWLTPCPATEDKWGPTDAPQVASTNLLAELMDAPESTGKQAALMAVQAVMQDLVTVAGFLLSLRGGNS